MTHGELIRHMEWADALVWGAVMAAPQTHGDTELRERLHHIHLVQGVFLQIWQGQEMKVREVSEFEDLPAVLAWARAYYAELPVFLAALDDSRLGEELHLPWRESLRERFGEILPTHLGETLTQVILHTLHHRAQVSTHFRALGGQPPQVDYIAWIWQGRPAPLWPPAD